MANTDTKELDMNTADSFEDEGRTTGHIGLGDDIE